MKNYERIRNMSVEELAELMAKAPCNICIHLKGQTCCGISCKQGVKQWLESEVTEE